jgi:hypothetical protein
MNHKLERGSRARKLVVAVVCAVLAAAATGGSVRAEDAPSCPSATKDAYSLQLRALTGPQETHATVEVDAKPGCQAVERLKKVQLKIFAADGSLADVQNLTDIAAPGGTASIAVGDLGRGRRLEADVLVQSGTPPRTYVLREETVVRLGPDLAVTGVFAPPQTLTVRPVDVVVDVEELNGDTGASAYVRLMLGDVPLADAAPITVGAGGKASATFAGIVLPDPVRTELTARVTDATPDETNTRNNTGKTFVEVTEHELERSLVFVPSLGGYGAQMNGHVYAGVLPAPEESMPDLEAKVKALEPQLVRIFFSDNQEIIAERRESFEKTVQLADEAGAMINITYQSVGRARNNPSAFMEVFAAELDYLVHELKLKNVRWVTIQNEPNSVNFTPQLIETMYRVLEPKLVARGLRDQIRFMGGDLIEFGDNDLAAPNHHTWWNYMATRMTDILDAYSVHIYWNYWDIPRMEFRLKDVREIVFEDLPLEARKPLYVTEFGVRGLRPGQPAAPPPGFWQDGTPLARTNIAAFQQLWFNIVSAQLGYAGTAKWDAYWGKYDTSYNAAHYLIGPPEEGWPLFPAYHALRMLLQTTERGWQVLGVAPWQEDDWKLSYDRRANDTPEKEIVAYADSGDELTLVGLDTHGRALNGVSNDVSSYSIGGLPPGKNLNLNLWNANGNGEKSFAREVSVNDEGVARFTVPVHAAFSLSTRKVS